MAVIARIDYKTFQVPLWSLVALVAVALFKGHINALDGILGAGLMISSLLIVEYVLTGKCLDEEDNKSLGSLKFWISRISPFSFHRLSMAYKEFMSKVSQLNDDDTAGKIGGGDFWLGTLMSLFMGFDRFLIAYTVAALLGTLAMWTIYRNDKIRDVAYVPYMAAGAFWAMFIAK